MAEMSEQPESVPEQAEMPAETPSMTTPPAEDAKPNLSEPERPKFRIHLPGPEGMLPSFLRRRLGRAARLVSFGLLVAVLGAAGLGSWIAAEHFGIGARPVARFTASVIPFRIVSTTPTDSSTDVLDATSIKLVFSRAVTPSKIDGDFFISPQVNGTYTRGDNDKEIVFTPSTPFKPGTIIRAMVHGEFQSDDGTQLGADYSFGFTMATADDSVTFQRGYFQYVVDSAPAGNTETYTMSVGHTVDKNGTLTVYKSDMSSLLKSLIYTEDRTQEGWVNTDFASPVVDTTAMSAVQTVKGLNDGQKFKIDQGEGVYAVVAESKGKQAGHFWLVVSSFGVVARQDDQQTVFYAHDYTDAVSPTMTVTSYNLKGSVQQLGQASIAGTGNMATGFSPQIDVFIAETTDHHLAFVPMAENSSMADIRVQKDLSASNLLYGLTDRPTYAVGETMHYAAFVRTDNDAQYTLPTAGSVQDLYIADASGAKLADLAATTTANGMIDGTIQIPASYASKSGPNQLTIYIKGGPGYSDGQFVSNDQPIASFTVLSKASASGHVVVSFPKSSYLANDTIKATVLALDSVGAPRANAKLTATVYAKQYYETDSQANQANLDSLGDRVGDSTVTLQTDASGKAILPINVSQLPAGQSQVVTVQVSYKDKLGTAAGGASTIVHQGNGVLVFGPSRSVIDSGGTLLARVYAQDLNGGALPGAAIDYTLKSITYGNDGEHDSNIAVGTAMADANGFAEISRKLPGSIAPGASLELDVSTGDAYNNQVTAKDYYYIRDTASTAYSEVQLTSLDISGAPTDVSVGQTLHLTVHAPVAVDALATIERGRVYKSEVVHLKQGDNTYDVAVTSQLLPSFNLVFSYITGGDFSVEGTSFNVSPSSKLADLQLTTNKSTYAANETATISLTAHDAATDPLATNVVLGVVDAHVFDFSATTTPNMLDFLYGPRETTINASSSLTVIGSGGGKCGGGGPEQPSLTNPTGKALLWNPGLATAADGTLKASVRLPKGTWRVYAYTVSGESVVGSTFVTVMSK